MEATWSTMEKKEKIMWIKKAAEDQKRYEVSVNSLKCPGGLHIICSQHRRELTVDLTLLNREICVRCAHLLLPLPQGRRWSLRVNPRNHHRKFVSSSSSVLPVVCVWNLCFDFFFSPRFWLSLETDIRSSLRRCCPTESWITSRWKSGWLRSAAAGRGCRWRRRTATRKLLRRSRDSTKSNWSSGSL